MAGKRKRELLSSVSKTNKKVSKNKVKKVSRHSTMAKSNLTSQNLPTRLEATKLIRGWAPLSIIKCKHCQEDMEQTHPCQRVCYQCKKDRARIGAKKWHDRNKDEEKRRRATQKKSCSTCDNQIRLGNTFCADCKVIRLKERMIQNEKRRRYKTMFKKHMSSILFR